MLDLAVALVGLLGLGIVIGVPYLLVSHWRMSGRVRALELDVRQLRSQISETPASQDLKDSIAQRAPDQPVARTETPPSEAVKSGLPWGGRKETAPDTAPLATSSEAETTDSPPKTPAAKSPPRAFVLRADLFDRLGTWLRDNWVLAAGAASLALAGIFLVQYGAEHGLLTPFWRVMTALGFGAALIAGGEVIRRRHGDEGAGPAQFLPSALAGAGLITLFSSVLASRVLYGLVEPGTTFSLLGLVSVVAVVLGWFYGPLLTALGLIGASSAPFLVGGASDDPWMLHYYFALVAGVGLAVDTIKRWAWISGLALVAPLGAMLLVQLSGASEQHFLSALLLITAAAIILPGRNLVPRHAGVGFWDLVTSKAGARSFPEFPTRLSMGMVLASAAGAIWVAAEAGSEVEVLLSLAALTVLFMACLLWLREASALFDHALVPGLAILTVVLMEGLNHGPLWRSFQVATERGPEVAAPKIIWVLVGLGALGSLLGYLRMQWCQPQMEDEMRDRTLFWCLSAAVFAPALVLVLEFTWVPTSVLGDYAWALTALAVAALMTLLAERSAKGHREGQGALLAALFAIAAFTMIALALFLVLAKTALTLALAVMAVLVVMIDRRFDLPALGLFVQIGIAVITFRLVIDPGFIWALDRDYIDEEWRYVTPLTQILLAYLGTLALLAMAWVQSRDTREKNAVVLESAGATILAVFVSILVLRLLPEEMRDGHAGLGLMATVWTASLVNQLYRMKMSGRFSLVLRWVLAMGYGLTALVSLAGLFVFTNPLLSSREEVMGPLLIDSLTAAFLPLAAVFAVAALRLNHMHRWLRLICALFASAIAAFYVALEIRRFWRGNDLSVPGVSDPELYSYTVALLVASAALLVVAFWRRSVPLRKVAMAGVVLTIAKVFLVDMSGLSGLMRVFSFMGLGLALVGLAWLNRVMTAQWEKGARALADPDPEAET